MASWHVTCAKGDVLCLASWTRNSEASMRHALHLAVQHQLDASPTAARNPLSTALLRLNGVGCEQCPEGQCCIVSIMVPEAPDGCKPKPSDDRAKWLLSASYGRACL